MSTNILERNEIDEMDDIDHIDWIDDIEKINEVDIGSNNIDNSSNNIDNSSNNIDDSSNNIDNSSNNIDNSSNDVDVTDSDSNDESESSQAALKDYLRGVDNNIEYIHIDKKVYGVLDFSILDVNHHNVKHIFIGEGNITEIINLPQSLKKLECSRNLLSSLLNLPHGIVEINASHNMITNLDLKHLSKLEKLNCSWNRLNSLSELPDSIIDINVNNNVISEIDLSGLLYLESLDCTYNTGITLKNVPSGIDLNVDTKGGSKKNEDEVNEEDNYEDVLNKYFKLKTEYQKMIDKLRDKNSLNVKNKNVQKASQLPNCVRCKRKGGTVFSKKNDKYYAVCGNQNICFEIEFDTKSKTINNIEESMNNSKLIVANRKEDIIRHKMDTLFGYINKDESSNVFIKKVEKYSEDNIKYEDLLKQYDDVFHNLEKEDKIQNGELAINALIEEMNVLNLKLSTHQHNDDVTLNISREVIIQDIVEIQIKVSEMNKVLTQLKYEFNEVCIKIDEKDDKIKKSKLSQSSVKFHSKFAILDKPQVLKFNFFSY
jgi:hypothetical protein